MAKKYHLGDPTLNTSLITVTPYEALQIIALLTAQLAKEALPYNSKGASPFLKATNEDDTVEQLIIKLEGDF
jgi:hypothetical protein